MLLSFPLQSATQKPQEKRKPLALEPRPENCKKKKKNKRKPNTKIDFKSMLLKNRRTYSKYSSVFILHLV